MKHNVHDACGPLKSPQRNHYFYGKLLTADVLVREQSYFTGVQRLLSRLTLGSGILCGLGVTADEDAVIILPGAALDSCGRLIVLPDKTIVDPRQLTDEQGNPGETVETGTVEICLLYDECLVEPVPVMVPECNTPGECAANTVEERVRVVVRAVGETGEESPEAHACALGKPPWPAGPELEELLCAWIGEACPDPKAALCVPLARVTLPGDSTELQVLPCANRRLIYGNPLLYELIACLIERVEQLASTLMLNMVSGNGQTADAEEELAQDPTVEVRDLEGALVPNVPVRFEATPGGALTTDESETGQETLEVTTDGSGLASVHWQLAGTPAHQELSATIQGAPGRVVFFATLAPQRRGGLRGLLRRNDDEPDDN